MSLLSAIIHHVLHIPLTNELYCSSNRKLFYLDFCYKKMYFIFNPAFCLVFFLVDATLLSCSSEGRHSLLAEGTRLWKYSSNPKNTKANMFKLFILKHFYDYCYFFISSDICSRYAHHIGASHFWVLYG